jgi:hypothetical protein
VKTCTILKRMASDKKLKEGEHVADIYISFEADEIKWSVSYTVLLKFFQKLHNKGLTGENPTDMERQQTCSGL